MSTKTTVDVKLQTTVWLEIFVARTLALVCAIASMTSTLAQTLTPVTPFHAEVDYSIESEALGQVEHAREWTIARDSAGRMRIDWGEYVLIADPVQRLYWDVDVRNRVVRTRAMDQGSARSADGVETVNLPETSSRNEVKPLGTKMIEGFTCEGTLYTQSGMVQHGPTVRAVSLRAEVWVAIGLRVPLQVTTSTQGRQTNYALHNIRLSEPAPELFLPPEAFEPLRN